MLAYGLTSGLTDVVGLQFNMQGQVLNIAEDPDAFQDLDVAVLPECAIAMPELAPGSGVYYAPTPDTETPGFYLVLQPAGMDIALSDLTNLLGSGQLRQPASSALTTTDAVSGLTLQQATRVVLSVLAGKLTRTTISGNEQLVFRDFTDTKDCVTAVVNANGRITISVDPD